MLHALCTDALHDDDDDDDDDAVICIALSCMCHIFICFSTNYQLLASYLK
jgi:hypothetical protein